MRRTVFMDVDGVIRYLAAVFRRYNPEEQIKSYDNKLFSTFWEYMAEDENRAKELYLNAPVVPGALSGLAWVRRRLNPSINFLTASDIKKWPWLRKYTEQWLRDSGCFKTGDSVTFVSSGEDKLPIISKQICTVFDDRVDTVNAVREPSTAVWVESGLVLDRARLRTGVNIHRISTLGALADNS